MLISISVGFILTYSAGVPTGKATVLVSLESDHASSLKFDVRLDPVTQNGEDITVNFFSPDIKNNGTFYTDSNGL
jgi:hypothetical protein